MTFHDDIHAQWEFIAKDSAGKLLLWLNTIAPVNQPFLVSELVALAEKMEWPVHYVSGAPLLIDANNHQP